MTGRLPSLDMLTARRDDSGLQLRDDSVKKAEALDYAEGHGSSFDGPDAALSSVHVMALEPLIRNQGG